MEVRLVVCLLKWKLMPLFLLVKDMNYLLKLH
jgi:hypothetical protein